MGGGRPTEERRRVRSALGRFELACATTRFRFAVGFPTVPKPPAAFTANEPSAIGAIEGLAERRVFEGFAFHLVLTLSETDLRALDAMNREILERPRSRAGAHVDYVLHLAGDDAEGARRWREAEAPAFENGSFVLYMPLR